jgi:transcriptional regulator with XRE-family HTH domain
MGKTRKDKVDEIIALIGEGYTDIEIADKAEMSRQTVSKYRRESQSAALGDSLKKSEAENRGLYTLSPTQIKRLLGLSHLEGGRDPQVLLDEILDRDSTVRRFLEHPDGMGSLVRYVEKSLRAGWEIPMLVQVQTLLWNTGVVGMKPGTVEGLAKMAAKLKELGWDPDSFVEEADNVKSVVYRYKEYKQGRITAKRFRAKVARV